VIVGHEAGGRWILKSRCWLLSRLNVGQCGGDDGRIGLFSGKELEEREEQDVVMWFQDGKLSRENPPLGNIANRKQREVLLDFIIQ